MELRYRPEFELDVTEAKVWYEKREAGLGVRFEYELEQALQRIAERPLSFPEIESGVRRALLKVFPYLVVFRMHSDFVEIGGVFHGARHPSLSRRRFRAQNDE